MKNQQTLCVTSAPPKFPAQYFYKRSQGPDEVLITLGYLLTLST